MNAMLPMDLPTAWDWLSPIPTLEERYRLAEAEAETAAKAVRAAADRYRADRSPTAQDAYRSADLRYDRARNAFQRASCDLMTARREAATAQQQAANEAAEQRLPL